MGGGGGGGEGEPEFQVAPMLDVLLALLIFFMSITSSQVEQIDKDIRLPIAPDAKERKPNPSQGVINIKWKDADQKSTMTFNKKEFGPEQAEDLQKAMEGFKEIKGEKTELLIRGDKDLPAKEVQKAMQIAGMAGIDTIAFSTYNQ